MTPPISIELFWIHTRGRDSRIHLCLIQLDLWLVSIQGSGAGINRTLLAHTSWVRYQEFGYLGKILPCYHPSGHWHKYISSKDSIAKVPMATVLLNVMLLRLVLSRFSKHPEPALSSCICQSGWISPPPRRMHTRWYRCTVPTCQGFFNYYY